MKSKALLFLILIFSSCLVHAQKSRFWLFGGEVSVPVELPGCNYNVTGIGAAIERGWHHSEKFVLIASMGYLYYKGETERRELGEKEFNYFFGSVGERFFAYKKLYIQAQVGLSSWGAAIIPSIGYQFNKIDIQGSYKYPRAAQTRECYVHPNKEHWGVRISYVLHK